MTLYLADSSVWAGRRRSDAGDLPERFVQRLRRSEIATCVPIALEVLTGAVDGQAYIEDWTRLWSQLRWLALRERATGRALEMQSELARVAPGAHRLSVSHFLIAACAEDAGPDVVLWHWDDDLAAICEHTGQPHERVATPAPLPLASTPAELPETEPSAELPSAGSRAGNGAPRPALSRPPWEVGGGA